MFKTILIPFLTSLACLMLSIVSYPNRAIDQHIILFMLIFVSTLALNINHGQFEDKNT